MKKILALLLCVVMCLSLAVTAFAADPTLTATLNVADNKVAQSAADQQVILTVNLSAPTKVSAIEYQAEVDTGLEIVDVTLDKLSSFSGAIGETTHKASLYSSNDIDNVSNVAKVTVKVPANTPVGIYTIKIKDVKIASFEKNTEFINGGSASATLTVYDPTVYVTGVSLNKSTLSLGIGRSETLVATVAPSNATNKNVTWSSDNEGVATVDQNGKVTGVKTGTATITVTTADGSKTATCTVTVSPLPVEEVTLDTSKSTVNYNSSTTIYATITPDDYYAQGITYRYDWSLSETAAGLHENTLATLSTYDAGDRVTLNAKTTKGTVTVYFKLYKVDADGKVPVAEVDIDIKIVDDISGLLGELVDDDMKFRDVSRVDYFYRPVAWAVSEGITDGMSRYTFAPDMACTRAQTVTFLWRAAGCPAPKTDSNPFSDVYVTDYYYDAVLWAVENGITNGTSATTFSPNATVTRAEVVTFLWRAEGEPGASMSGVFTDVAAGAYYAEAVAWAVDMGITEGVSSSTFAPNAACTRAQIVTFLYRNR